MENRDIAVALHQIPGVGTGILTKLHQITQGEWKMLLEEDAAEIFYELNLSKDLIPILLEQLSPNKIVEVKSLLEEKNIHVVMIEEGEYPPQLKEIDHPPFLLYGLGDMKLLLHQNSIGIVGTRAPSSYGQMVAHRLSGDLASAGWVVVSGMAAGIDAHAHRGALSVKGKTIAVLGCGVDVVYPKDHQKLYKEISETGLIVSEYPPGTQPTRGLFPQRNRIISGLSRGVIIVECHQKSGSLITASWALEQGREVFAVPGSILSAKSAGPNQLIKEGAKLITSARDVIDEFAFSHTKDPINHSLQEDTSLLTEDEQHLLDIISYTHIHIDEILRSTRLSPGQVHKSLLSLELKKRITKLPGFFYMKNRIATD